jgi:hypothetical protein
MLERVLPPSAPAAAACWGRVQRASAAVKRIEVHRAVEAVPTHLTVRQEGAIPRGGVLVGLSAETRHARDGAQAQRVRVGRQEVASERWAIDPLDPVAASRRGRRLREQRHVPFDRRMLDVPDGRRLDQERVRIDHLQLAVDVLDPVRLRVLEHYEAERVAQERPVHGFVSQVVVLDDPRE